MANLVIATDTGTVTFTPLPAAAQGSTGKFWTRVPYSGPQYRVEEFRGPGQTGKAAKRHGFENRDFELEVVYISASADAARVARDGDEATISNQNATITIPGVTAFQNCEILNTRTIKGPRKTETGNARLHVVITAKQLRE